MKAYNLVKKLIEKENTGDYYKITEEEFVTFFYHVLSEDIRRNYIIHGFPTIVIDGYKQHCMQFRGKPVIAVYEK